MHMTEDQPGAIRSTGGWWKAWRRILVIFLVLCAVAVFYYEVWPRIRAEQSRQSALRALEDIPLLPGSTSLATASASAVAVPNCFRGYAEAFYGTDLMPTVVHDYYRDHVPSGAWRISPESQGQGVSAVFYSSDHQYAMIIRVLNPGEVWSPGSTGATFPSAVPAGIVNAASLRFKTVYYVRVTNLPLDTVMCWCCGG